MVMGNGQEGCGSVHESPVSYGERAGNDSPYGRAGRSGYFWESAMMRLSRRKVMRRCG
jgi:hypothetical protein